MEMEMGGAGGWCEGKTMRGKGRDDRMCFAFEDRWEVIRCEGKGQVHGASSPKVDREMSQRGRRIVHAHVAVQFEQHTASNVNRSRESESWRRDISYGTAGKRGTGEAV